MKKFFLITLAIVQMVSLTTQVTNSMQNTSEEHLHPEDQSLKLSYLIASFQTQLTNLSQNNPEGGFPEFSDVMTSMITQLKNLMQNTSEDSHSEFSKFMATITNLIQTNPEDSTLDKQSDQISDYSDYLDQYSRELSEDEINFIKDPLFEGHEFRIIDRKSILHKENIENLPINKQLVSLYLNQGIKYAVDQTLAAKNEPLKTEFITAIKSLFDDKVGNPALDLLDTIIRFRFKHKDPMDLIVQFSSQASEPSAFITEYHGETFNF